MTLNYKDLKKEFIKKQRELDDKKAITAPVSSTLVTTFESRKKEVSKRCYSRRYANQ